MVRILLIAVLLSATSALGAPPEWIAAFGRGADAADTDIVRLAYRQPLKESNAWWMPSHLQYGASAWRVPDIAGTTRRLDLSASGIWRTDRPWGYAEAGFGPYLLSKTIHNDDTSMPSSLEFGSHLGVGFRLTKNQTLGVGIQHLSNAGIKQPNGGINLLLLQYTVSTGTPNR
jgi:hypothetical protein